MCVTGYPRLTFDVGEDVKMAQEMLPRPLPISIHLQSSLYKHDRRVKEGGEKLYIYVRPYTKDSL